MPDPAASAHSLSMPWVHAGGGNGSRSITDKPGRMPSRYSVKRAPQMLAAVHLHSLQAWDTPSALQIKRKRQTQEPVQEDLDWLESNILLLPEMAGRAVFTEEDKRRLLLCIMDDEDPEEGEQMFPGCCSSTVTQCQKHLRSQTVHYDRQQQNRAGYC